MKPSPNAVDQDDLIVSDVATEAAFKAVESADHLPPKKNAPLHCERCGYNWHAQAGVPLQCSYCHSTYYTRPLKLLPAAAAEHQRLARERAGKRRIREAKQARIKRLKRIATKLGKESVGVVQELFPVPEFVHETKPDVVFKVDLPPPRFLPPPPKFEDSE